MSGALLLDERMVSAQPSLVRALGLTKAVVLQQIHWNMVYGHGQVHDEHEWFPITMADLAGEIGVTRDVVRRAIEAMEQDGILLSCQPEGRVSRRKWYRIDRTHATFTGDSDPPTPNGRLSPIGMGEAAHSGEGEAAHSSSVQHGELLEHERERSEPSTREDDAGDQEQTRPPDAEKPKRTRERKPRDDVWDALVEVFGPPATTHERSHYGKVVSELVAAGADGPTTLARARRARREVSSCSVAYVSKHWTRLGGGGSRSGRAQDLDEWDRSEPSRRVDL